jgi:hypothetical protein
MHSSLLIIDMLEFINCLSFFQIAGLDLYTTAGLEVDLAVN